LQIVLNKAVARHEILVDLQGFPIVSPPVAGLPHNAQDDSGNRRLVSDLFYYALAHVRPPSNHGPDYSAYGKDDSRHGHPHSNYGTTHSGDGNAHSDDGDDQ